MNTETWMETFKEDLNYDDIEYDDSSLEGVERDLLIHVVQLNFLI